MGCIISLSIPEFDCGDYYINHSNKLKNTSIHQAVESIFGVNTLLSNFIVYVESVIAEPFQIEFGFFASKITTVFKMKRIVLHKDRPPFQKNELFDFDSFVTRMVNAEYDDKYGFSPCENKEHRQVRYNKLYAKNYEEDYHKYLKLNQVINESKYQRWKKSWIETDIGWFDLSEEIPFEEFTFEFNDEGGYPDIENPSDNHVQKAIHFLTAENAIITHKDLKLL